MIYLMVHTRGTNELLNGCLIDTKKVQQICAQEKGDVGSLY